MQRRERTKATKVQRRGKMATKRILNMVLAEGLTIMNCGKCAIYGEAVLSMVEAVELM